MTIAVAEIRRRIRGLFELVLWLGLTLTTTTTTATATTTWTCDALTPQMCTLEEVFGRIQVNDAISVPYVKYTADPQAQKTNPQGYHPKYHPILVIHGGPGVVTHSYLAPLRQWACRDPGRDVIFYDQAGTRNDTTTSSSLLVDLGTAYYAHQELPAVLSQLGLHNNPFHIVADAWGTMIAMQAFFSTSTTGVVQSMIMMNPIPNMTQYFTTNWNPRTGTIGTMPTYFRQRYWNLAQQQQQNTEWDEMEDVLTRQFVVRTGVIPDCVQKALSQATQAKAIFEKLWGPSLFFPNRSATLQSFDIYQGLTERSVKSWIKRLPVLWMAGEYSLTRPAVLEALHGKFPRSEKLILPAAGQALVTDATEPVLDAGYDFVKRVEQRRAGRFWPIDQSKMSWAQPQMVPSTRSGSSSRARPSNSYAYPKRRRHPLRTLFLWGALAWMAWYVWKRRHRLGGFMNQYPFANAGPTYRYDTVV